MDETIENMDIEEDDELRKFEANLDSYYLSIKTWIEESKPYLRKDFRLMDVAEHLPMCRAYLSKVFNEGFGSSFSGVVRRYRIEEAKRLLESEPSMRLGMVSEMSGFSSVGTFHRAFAQACGVTPAQYRRDVLEK